MLCGCSNLLIVSDICWQNMSYLCVNIVLCLKAYYSLSVKKTTSIHLSIHNCSINLFQTFLPWKILESVPENGIFDRRFCKQEKKIASTAVFRKNQELKFKTTMENCIKVRGKLNLWRKNRRNRATSSIFIQSLSIHLPKIEFTSNKSRIMLF